MVSKDGDCALCRAAGADPELGRVQVWEDDLWRLTMSMDSYTPAFSYLEPKRHIPYITDLDGREAGTFGAVMARVTSVLKEITATEVVYVYIFGGGIPHLHVHLAPHAQGDALADTMIRGEVAEEKLPSGATALISKEFAPIPRAELEDLATRARQLLSAGAVNSSR
jgi:diadenosine tetraphosphate (Ap4A) HIT family hydrolase